MQQLKEHIGSTQFLERLLKAESGILCVNLACGLFIGWGLVGMPIIFVLPCLAIYRLLILSGLKDGSVIATWWYSVTSFFFVLRFGLIIAAQFGVSFGRFAIARDMVSPFALMFLMAVVLVRLAGLSRTLLFDLHSRTRLTALTVMGLGAGGCFAGIGWVLFAAAFETIFYGFKLRLH